MNEDSSLRSLCLLLSSCLYCMLYYKDMHGAVLPSGCSLGSAPLSAARRATYLRHPAGVQCRHGFSCLEALIAQVACQSKCPVRKPHFSGAAVVFSLTEGPTGSL